MKSLDKPIVLQDDILGVRTIHNFREYAKEMMLPDPTYVVMSDEVSDLVTEYINEGGDAWSVFRVLASGYKYDDNGQEYVSFPDEKRTKEFLQKFRERDIMRKKRKEEACDENSRVRGEEPH